VRSRFFQIPRSCFKVHMKFFQMSFEKKFQLKKWGRKLKIGVEMFWKSSVFWAETFFKDLYKIFLWTLRTCSGYLKGPPDLDLCPSKKIVTARLIRLYAKKSEKNWDFEKRSPNVLSWNFISTLQDLKFQTSDGHVKKIDRSNRSSWVSISHALSIRYEMTALEVRKCSNTPLTTWSGAVLEPFTALILNTGITTFLDVCLFTRVFLSFFCLSLLILISVRFELLFCTQHAQKKPWARAFDFNHCRFSDQVSKLNWRSEREFWTVKEREKWILLRSGNRFCVEKCNTKSGSPPWQKLNGAAIRCFEVDLRNLPANEKGFYVLRFRTSKRLIWHNFWWCINVCPQKIFDFFFPPLFFFVFFTKTSFVSIKIN